MALPRVEERSSQTAESRDHCHLLFMLQAKRGSRSEQ
jgi:hypothetical protein